MPHPINVPVVSVIALICMICWACPWQWPLERSHSEPMQIPLGILLDYELRGAAATIVNIGVHLRNASGILHEMVVLFILIQLLVFGEVSDFVWLSYNMYKNRIAYAQGNIAGNLSIRLNCTIPCLRGYLELL